MRAERAREGLPPQIRKALEEAEAEEKALYSLHDGLIDPLNTIPKEFVKQLWTIASELSFRPLLIILKVDAKP